MLRQMLTGNLGGSCCNDGVMTIASKSSGQGGIAGGGSGGGSCCCAVALHFAFAPLKSSIASKKAWHRMQSSRGGSPCTGHEAGRVGQAATEGTSSGAVGGGRSGGSCSCDGAVDINRTSSGASRRRRFKKPHGWDCESCLFMDRNTGAGVKVLGTWAGVFVFVVDSDLCEKSVVVTSVFGKCGKSHVSKK